MNKTLEVYKINGEYGVLASDHYDYEPSTPLGLRTFSTPALALADFGLQVDANCSSRAEVKFSPNAYASVELLKTHGFSV